MDEVISNFFILMSSFFEGIISEGSWLLIPLFGNEVWRLLLSLSMLVFGYPLIGRLFKKLQTQIGEKKKRGSALFLRLINALVTPAPSVLYSLWMICSINVIHWPESVETVLTLILIALLGLYSILVSCQFICLGVDSWKRYHKRTRGEILNIQLYSLVEHVLKIFFTLTLALTTLHNMGLNITSLIASLSIGSLAVALAAQDTLGNFFGALTLFVDSPYRVGDRIKVLGVDGIVQSVGLRSTVILSRDEEHQVTIPNKELAASVITNVTRRQSIKTRVVIGLVYETSQEKLHLAIDLIKNILDEDPKVEDELVTFSEFNSYSLDIEVYFWYRNTNFKGRREGLSKINFAIKEAFEKAGIEMAFPTQTVQLQSV